MSDKRLLQYTAEYNLPNPLFIRITIVKCTIKHSQCSDQKPVITVKYSGPYCIYAEYLNRELANYLPAVATSSLSLRQIIVICVMDNVYTNFHYYMIQCRMWMHKWVYQFWCCSLGTWPNSLWVQRVALSSMQKWSKTWELRIEEIIESFRSNISGEEIWSM